MTSITFPRVVAAGLAACLMAGLAHQGYATLVSRRHHEGFEPHTLRCTSGNLITYYLRRGTPGSPTLVCEAGLISTSLVWRLLADHLSPEISLVLYDRAGYRRSLRRCEEDYCLQESVNDLIEVIQDGADPEAPCILTGHSLGAYLAHRAAASLPERVQGLVLIDPNHPRELIHSPRQREGSRGANLTIRLAPWSIFFGGGLLMDKKGLLVSVEGSPYHRLLRWEASTHSAWRTARREWGYSYPYMLDGGRPLEKLSIPVSVLAAEATMRTVPEHKDMYEEYVGSGSGGEIITIPDSNHQSIVAGVRCVGPTAAAIEEFVSHVVSNRRGDELMGEAEA
jgi:pimeloyl-ACP methyl ester carboxylesterase